MGADGFARCRCLASYAAEPAAANGPAPAGAKGKMAVAAPETELKITNLEPSPSSPKLGSSSCRGGCGEERCSYVSDCGVGEA